MIGGLAAADIVATLARMTVRSVYDPPAGPLPGAVPGYWHEMRSTIDKAIALTRAGKCAKSKRVAWLQSPVGAWDPVLGVNGPPVELPCSGDQACRDACAKICTHAEERVLLRVLRDGFDGPIDMFHLEVVDDQPMPFDRAGKDAGPSCITCARLMLQGHVRLVWLYGVDGWRWWASDIFYRDTVAHLGLASPERLAMFGKGVQE